MNAADPGNRDSTRGPVPGGADNREKRLLRITAAICDGVPVDWEAERKRSPDLSEMLRRLEMLERIRNASRT